MDLIVGTAGHIDHGKTSLIKALTGVDADRLPEEKQRGITIDLGFAEMEIGPSRIGFVDVPGHERFVKNMLAGASGIDVMLLVVAADEGVMPQTREHFEICRLLGVRQGIIAITKTDSSDAETVDLASIYAAELTAGTPFENAPMVRVSSRTGSGISELRSMLANAAETVERRNNHLVTRLPIDRSFTIKGFGTVVTGTLASGEITVNSRLELMPGGRPVRIRGLQAYSEPTERAAVGQRIAANLAGVDHDQVIRGMELVEAGTLQPTQIIDAEIEMLATSPAPLRSRQRVRVHLGTAEILARVQVLSDETTEIIPGRTDLLQLRLETLAVAVPGQRFIIRSYSPQVTIAGGTVIDNLAARHRRKDLGRVRHELLGRSSALDDPIRTVALIVEHSERTGISRSNLQAACALANNVFQGAVERNLASRSIVDADGIYLSEYYFAQIEHDVQEFLAAFHRKNPLERGISREALMSGSLPYLHPNIGVAVIRRLSDQRRVAVQNDLMRLSTHSSQMAPDEAAFTQGILSLLEAAGLEVPRIADAVQAERKSLSPERAAKLLRLVVDSRRIVKVTDEFYFAAASIERTIEALRTRGGDIDVAAFKEMTGVSRKYAIPLLEYFDRTHVTARVGDKRVIL
jgi:selenocysteine-specific elongation factor